MKELFTCLDGPLRGRMFQLDTRMAGLPVVLDGGHSGVHDYRVDPLKLYLHHAVADGPGQADA